MPLIGAGDSSYYFTRLRFDIQTDIPVDTALAGGLLSVVGGPPQKLDYLTARWTIYVRLYAELVKTTEAFSKLRQLYSRGAKLELLDVDCPTSIEVTPATFGEYVVNSKLAFGHTWVLAACLQGWL